MLLCTVMKLLIVFIGIKVCSAADLLEHHHKTFVFGIGNDIRVIDTEETIDEVISLLLTREEYNSTYWLSTRAKPPQTTPPVQLLPNNKDSILNSGFDPAKTTIFISHGWLENYQSDICFELTQAFLENDDVNVIVLDWHDLSHQNYITAKAGVPEVGRRLGKFINWLVTLGLDYEKTHLVGFSLGGHVVGLAGRETGSRVRRITALDPAGPFYKKEDVSNRIVRTDAKHVEVIHTNTDFLGFAEPCGHADFYPNGGGFMPDCLVTVCCHFKSWRYMAYTVRYNNLTANHCQNLDEALNDECTGYLYPMGNSDLTKDRTGIFRIDTYI